MKEDVLHLVPGTLTGVRCLQRVIRVAGRGGPGPFPGRVLRRDASELPFHISLCASGQKVPLLFPVYLIEVNLPGCGVFPPVGFLLPPCGMEATAARRENGCRTGKGAALPEARKGYSPALAVSSGWNRFISLVGHPLLYISHGLIDNPGIITEIRRKISTHVELVQTQEKGCSGSAARGE